MPAVAGHARQDAHAHQVRAVDVPDACGDCRTHARHTERQRAAEPDTPVAVGSAGSMRRAVDQMPIGSAWAASVRST